MAKLNETASHYIGEEVDACVLTVPVWFSKEQKDTMVKVRARVGIAC